MPTARPRRRTPPSTFAVVESALLVDLARSGDNAAFDELIRRYRPRIHALALHLTGDRHDADDVTQEAFLRAYRKLAEFRAAADFYTWVYRIAVNLALNVQRANGRRRTASMDDPRVALAVAVDASGDPRRAAELRQIYTRLVDALDRLSPPLRSTVVLVALQGLSHEEAGQVLGCPSGTIACRLPEARKHLSAALEPPPRAPTPPRVPAAAAARTTASRAITPPPVPKPSAKAHSDEKSVSLGLLVPFFSG